MPDILLGRVLLALCGIWALSELALIVFRRAGVSANGQDARTLRMLNLTIYSAVGVGVWVSFLPFARVEAAGVRWAGLGLIAAGLVFRWAAILTLRRYFTVNVAILEDHRLVRTGLYRTIRHPSYTGVLISFLGLGPALGSWAAMLVIMAPITAAFIRRITIEEQALRAAFPKEYPNMPPRAGACFRGSTRVHRIFCALMDREHIYPVFWNVPWEWRSGRSARVRI